MTQGERVKKIRKSLDLTLEKFGAKLGVTKTTVSRIENGINNLTDQMTKSICREFGVDYIWLTTGEGEMFATFDDELSLDKFAKTHNATKSDYQLIRNYLSLDPSIRTQIQSLFTFKE